jgi:hypothetical protein
VQCYVLKHISPKKKKPPNVPKVIADWFETDSTFSFSENLRKLIQKHCQPWVFFVLMMLIKKCLPVLLSPQAKKLNFCPIPGSKPSISRQKSAQNCRFPIKNAPVRHFFAPRHDESEPRSQHAIAFPESLNHPGFVLRDSDNLRE